MVDYVVNCIIQASVKDISRRKEVKLRRFLESAFKEKFDLDSVDIQNRKSALWILHVGAEGEKGDTCRPVS